MISQMTNTFFPICSIFVSLLIFIIFKSKKRVENVETNIYSKLITIGLFESILMFLICFAANFMFNDSTLFLFEIANKLLCSLYVIWITMMLYYIHSITQHSKIDFIAKQEKLKKILMIATPIIIVLLWLAKVDISVLPDTHQSSAVGSMVYITFGTILFYTLNGIILVLKSFKEIKEKHKLIPCLVFSILLLISLAIFTIDQYFNVTSNILSFTLLIMYFTIENPDIKILEEVSIAKESAEKANSAKTEFLSNMSHEIRTPLNAIVGFSESLKDDNVPEETRGKINDIITASNNLLEIVNGILDISKIEANKLELVNKEYDIKSTLDELESLTRARIGEKGLELNVKIDPTLPRVLYGDNVRLKQVILNILTNAVKYTKEGHIDFTVSSVVKDDMCRLIVSVEDTGIGIKQENINKLFSKFERLDVEKQMTIEGTGLGLAITKKLVDLMGGTIVAQSVYGQGSKFTVSVEDTGIGIKQENINKLFSKFERLDVEKQMTIEGTGLGLAITKKLVDLMGGTIVAQSVYGQGSKFTVSVDQKIISVKAIEKPKPILESKIIDVSGAKALIVDDNELNIKVASTLLKKYNFTIDSCTNGQDCINKLVKDDSYDIIFLDDMMPRMSGREVIKKLRQAEGFNIPTIALTANAIEGMKEEYLACGFDDYLSKPIEKPELERVIKTYLNKMVNDNVASTSSNEIASALPISIEVPAETKKKKVKYTNCTGKNFLLVDDSEIELKVTGNLLEKNNCKITKVRSGSECIVKVIDKPYDLILMDDTMPNLSGVETIENIEQIDGFATPIILLTNAKGEELDKKLKSKNIIGHLRKPVDKYELNELLKKVATKKGDK